MTPNRPLHIGFIGGGLNSAIGTTHRIAAEMDKRWKVTAGCFSRHRNVNIATAEAWAIDRSRVYFSWEKLLEAEKQNLDAIAVLTPTPSHVEMVLKALNRGYAVICEKTLATRVADAERIRKTVRMNKSFLAVVYNYTGYPM
jgi:predicted dehydrogenase